METVFKHLSVFINNEESWLLFSKNVHQEAKKSLGVFAFFRISVIALPDIEIRGIEGCLMLFGMLFRKLFLYGQYTH